MLAFLFQQCYSQSGKAKNTTMDNTTGHPDSSFVNHTDEEWKKLLPSDVYYVPVKKERKGHLPANLKRPRKSEPIIVPFVETRCFAVIQNLKVAAAGPVFMSLSVKPALSI